MTERIRATAPPATLPLRQRRRVRLVGLGACAFLGAMAALLLWHVFAEDELLQQHIRTLEQLEQMDPADVRIYSRDGEPKHLHPPPTSWHDEFTEAEQKRLLIRAALVALRDSNTSFCSFFVPIRRVRFAGPDCSVDVLLGGGNSEFAIGGDTTTWRNGAELLHVSFNAYLVSEAPEVKESYWSLQASLQSMISLRKHFPERVAQWMDDLRSLAPVVVRIEANPGRELPDYWQIIGQTREEYIASQGK